MLGHLRLQVAAIDPRVNADFENGVADDPEGVAANVTLTLDTGIAGLSVQEWSGSILYDTDLAAPEIMAGRPPAKAMTMPIMKEANRPTYRSMPATKEKAIHSGVRARVATMPARMSRGALAAPLNHPAR